MKRNANRLNWTPSFNQRLVLARAEAYEVSTTLPRNQQGSARARFWVHWIQRNAFEHQANAGSKL